MGRVRVDNYIMAVCDNNPKCTLIDGTYSATAIHIGQDNHYRRDGHLNQDNYQWNDLILNKQPKLRSSLYNPKRVVLMRNTETYLLVRRNEWNLTILNCGV